MPIQGDSKAGEPVSWFVYFADHLRKGAALNAVQIAEILIRDYL